MTIEWDFDIAFIANLALREKQIQQNYRPIIAVHKWFARRPGALFRGLLLAEFVQAPLKEAYYHSHDLPGKRVADPFMGGGTPLLEANRMGCDVNGFDINPMAYWIVRQEMASLDMGCYRRAAESLVVSLSDEVGAYYKTRCVACGSADASVKYFLWVKQNHCEKCKEDFDLFPGYLLSEDRRHPANVMICPACGKLNEVADRHHPGHCHYCKNLLVFAGPAKRNACACPRCGCEWRYPSSKHGPPRHRMFAIEYHCPACKPQHTGRFFKEPDEQDLASYAAAVEAFRKSSQENIPEDDIPRGDETDRLHRWGYRRYRDMFNERQLLGLSHGARLIASIEDAEVRYALATNFSDLLRYQNMLCRYDTMALKSLDIFSVHGFPVGLVQCESNLLGIPAGNGASVGSGGWSNIIEKFAKAKAYCYDPFEIRMEGAKKSVVACRGEWIGANRSGPRPSRPREISLHCLNSANHEMPSGSLDAVLTDPPYFGNIQYAELMDFCYVWLRTILGKEIPAFAAPSTRNGNELTGNQTLERGVEHFAGGLSAVFQKVAAALKNGGPLAFTFHHNRLESYFPVTVAILDSGLVCTASIPCPAEMGASIHINGTGSSIVDSIFVCRATGMMRRDWLASTPQEVARIVEQDLEKLGQGGLNPTRGDIRCVIFGHLARLAAWQLKSRWDKRKPIEEKLAAVAQEIQGLPSQEEIEKALGEISQNAQRRQAWQAMEAAVSYERGRDAIPF